MLAEVLSPRPAATLILARDAACGMEVLMLRRSTQADYISGAYVFPGGAVAAEDRSDDLVSLCGRDPGDEDLPYSICAIRECFEEAGLLLAYDDAGTMIDLNAGAIADRFVALRQQINAGELSFIRLCLDQKLKPAIGQLIFFSHWIAPLSVSKRFDTRYFVAVAPEFQSPSHDEAETIAHTWVRPAEALRRHKQGEIDLVFPTIRTLETLSGFDSVVALIAHARQPRVITPIQPRLATGRAGIRPVAPDEAAYGEIGKLDPHGKICASYEILPGVTVRLSERVRRITAANASYMTGPGTNTYLVNVGDDIAIIDPGPADPTHVQRLMEEAQGHIRWILATHTHPDHSPAAALLKAQSGASVWGLPPPAGSIDDRSFKPDRVLAHGERLQIAGCTLRVMHTPGHASNHLCYLLEEERLLFTGDHIMQGSTVIINPPDGNMAAYLASLRAILDEDVAYFAPAHGFLMDWPRQVVEWLLAHRLEREHKICKALGEFPEASVEMLLPLAYDDVSANIHPYAARSLLAHLIKLETEQRVSHREGKWRAQGHEGAAMPTSPLSFASAD